MLRRIVNSKADGLPTGVSPTDVRMLQATSQGLALVTCNGDAYIITHHSSMYGNNLSGSTSRWNRIEVAANTYLTNVIHMRITRYSAIALTRDNKLYTWGLYTYLGNASSITSNYRAVEMTHPSPVTQSK